MTYRNKLTAGALVIAILLPLLVYADVTTNLQACWKLNESSGNASDSTANVNTLTNNNSTAYAAGIIGNGADFELSNSNSLSILDAAQTGLDVTGSYSWSFWTKLEQLPSTAGTDMYIMSKYNFDTAPNGYVIVINSAANKLGATWIYGPSTSVTSFTVNTALGAPDVGTWIHWVIVFDNSTDPPTPTVYRNGSSVAFTYGNHDARATYSGNSEVFRMGSGNQNSGATLFFDGVIDEVALYDKVLAAGDVTTLYNGGAAYNTQCGGAAAVVAAFWAFWDF